MLDNWWSRFSAIKYLSFISKEMNHSWTVAIKWRTNPQWEMLFSTTVCHHSLRAIQFILSGNVLCLKNRYCSTFYEELCYHAFIFCAPLIKKLFYFIIFYYDYDLILRFSGGQVRMCDITLWFYQFESIMHVRNHSHYQKRACLIPPWIKLAQMVGMLHMHQLLYDYEQCNKYFHQDYTQHGNKNRNNMRN